MDNSFLRRLKSIAEQGHARGMAVDIGDYVDAVIHFRPTRRLPKDVEGRRGLRGQRVVIQRDLISALTHAARIYRTVIHIKVDPTDSICDMLRKSRFTNNMLCEMSDGSRIELDRGRLFTYDGKSNGSV
jgi:hypothetical protein